MQLDNLYHERLRTTTTRRRRTVAVLLYATSYSSNCTQTTLRPATVCYFMSSVNNPIQKWVSQSQTKMTNRERESADSFNKEVIDWGGIIKYIPGVKWTLIAVCTLYRGMSRDRNDCVEEFTLTSEITNVISSMLRFDERIIETIVSDDAWCVVLIYHFYVGCKLYLPLGGHCDYVITLCGHL